jgi:peptide/nickel transport system permease protein
MVLGVATLVFVVLHLAPGDPALLLTSPRMTPEALAQVRSRFGLDSPLWERYLRWLAALARGELGVSLSRGQAVTRVLAGAAGPTAVLGLLSLLLSFALGTALGLLQALRRDTALDHAATWVTLLLYGMPAFWLALMLVLVFSRGGGLGGILALPASGLVSVDHDLMALPVRLFDRLRHLVLPVATLTLVLGSGVARYARAALLQVLEAEHVQAARARGLPERTVLLGHALRTALLPLVTLLGLYLPVLLSGSVFVEQVFGLPGMGKLLVDAVYARDYPLVMGCTLVFAGIVVLGSLVADVLALSADPRIREGV